MNQSNLKILIDGNSFIRYEQKDPISGKTEPVLDPQLATSTARVMLKEYKPWFISLVISEENASLFGEVLDIYDSFGIPTNVSDQPIADFRSEIHDGTDFVVCSNDRAYCQLLLDSKGKVYHINDDSYIDYETIKNQLGIDPFWIPVVLAALGDPDRKIMPLSDIPMGKLIDVINSNSTSVVSILKAIIEQSPNTDPKELQKRVKECYQSNVGQVITYDFNRRELEANKLYKNYSKHDFSFWLPDHVRQSQGLPLVAGQGVRVVDANKNWSRFEADLKIKKSCMLFLDTTVAGRSLMGVSTEQSDVFYLNTRSEEFEKFISLVVNTDDFGLYTNDIKYIQSKVDLPFEFTDKLILDFETAYFQRNSGFKKNTAEQKAKELADIDIPEFNSTLVRSTTSGLVDYLAANSDSSFRCAKKLHSHLSSEGILDFHTKYDAQLSSILSIMEKDGVFVDVDMINQQYPKISKITQELEDKIKSFSSSKIEKLTTANITSLIFDELGLKSRERNTAKENLETMVDQHEVIQMIIDYRAFTDIKTSANSLKNKVNENGLVHAKIMPFNAVTGRLSTQEPNLQSLPSKNKDAAYIKQAIKSRFGNGKIIAADYSQIELRVLAHLSGDESLIDAFNKGLDAHAATAAKILGVGIDQVTPEQRRAAKSVNFGIIYGMQEFGLANKLKASIMVARNYIRDYFSSLPKVEVFLEKIKENAKKDGFVQTLHGRKIHTPKAQSSNFAEQQRGMRQASNAPMQGTAAEIMKIAMVDIFNDMRKNNLKSKMIMQVHDELVFDTHPDEVSIMHSIIKTRMENAVKLSVPLSVDIGVADNWEMSHSLDSETKEKVKKQTSELAPAL